MRRLIQIAALCAAISTTAQADIIYQGRDAQGLHCAAMLGVASILVYEAVALSKRELDISAAVAAIILSQLPGTNAERTRAWQHRAEKIARTRSVAQLSHEFSSTSKWCKREFLR